MNNKIYVPIHGINQCILCGDCNFNNKGYCFLNTRDLRSIFAYQRILVTLNHKLCKDTHTIDEFQNNIPKRQITNNDDLMTYHRSLSVIQCFISTTNELSYI